jgi:uncharacterized protein (DUF433 family)
MTDRITIEPGKRSGQPRLRGLRITVWDVLSWLAARMTEQEILDDYPELESADFRDVYEFAARMGRRVALRSGCLTRTSLANSFCGLLNCSPVPRTL